MWPQGTFHGACRTPWPSRSFRKSHALYDAVSSCRPVKVTFPRPFLESFAPVMTRAATSQQTAAVPAMAPGAARPSLSNLEWQTPGDFSWSVPDPVAFSKLPKKSPLYPKPYTPNPRPQTPNTTLQTPNPQTHAPNPKLQTLRPKP